MGRPPRKVPAPRPEEVIEGKEAIKEAAALAADVDLSDRQKLSHLNNMARSDLREHHINIVLIIGIYFAALCCGGMFLVLVLMFCLPDHFRFLTPDETGQLKSFLLSGAVGTLLTQGVRRISRPDK